MVEDAGIVKVDEAERRVREEIRRLGNETLTGWAQTRGEQSANEAILKADWVRSGPNNSIGILAVEKFK